MHRSHISVFVVLVFLFSSLGSRAPKNGTVFGQDSATTVRYTEAREEGPRKNLRIAVCLTGQLLRLEILTKLRYLIAHNSVNLGHKIDLFVLLDNDKLEAKQTFWRHDYSNSPYRNMTTRLLRKHLEEQVKLSISNLTAQSPNQNRTRTPLHPTIRVNLSPLTQSNYTIRDGKVPVGDKTGPNGEGLPTVGDFEPAADRFQNNMRWLAGLRDCVKWVERSEYERKWFYDVVIRLRDDSYFLGPWSIDAETYKGAFVTAAVAPNFGVNDHNFAIDRRWADSVFRGVIEDYYFNETLDMYSWPNTEHRIYKILTTKQVPIRTVGVCDHPVAHLRGRINATHWRLHPTYSQLMVLACGKDDGLKVKTMSDVTSVSISVPPAPLKKQPTFWKNAMHFFGMFHSPKNDIPSSEEKQISSDVQNALRTSKEIPYLNTTNAVKSCCPLEWISTLNSGSVPISL